MASRHDPGPADLNTNFKDYQDRVTASLVNVTRTAGQLSNHDLSFHRTSNESLSRSLDFQNAHLLRLTNKLLKAATKDTNIQTPNLKNQDDVEFNWRGIIDVVDDLLEKADASLDEFTGVMRRMSPALPDGAQTPPVQARFQRNNNTWSKPSIEKPQLYFDKKVDNFDVTPFRPLLKTKPHALVPLDECLANGSKHPYAREIEQSDFPPSVYQQAPPIMFGPPNETPVIWVDTMEAVEEMLRELKQATEIAVDLEHHDRHSYFGIVSLMQISTRNKDWVVDTLKPWREELQILNQVFTNPNILKVFHGSNLDMIWLQRDLGLYVVGLFDTYHACVALNFPGRGLKYLLQRFANFEAQKQYQLADWRLRPLTPELLDYAKSDTHYLLYVYDNIRNMLLEQSTPQQNLVEKVRDESKAEALQVYEKPVYDFETGSGSNGWFGTIMQRTVTFDNEQFAVFRAFHQWRDQKARVLDEGLQTIMPNGAIWTLAEHMPMHSGALFTCMRPMPKYVADNTKEILDLVKKAKYEGKNGPTIGQIIQQHGLKYAYPNRRWRREKEEQQKSQYSGLAGTLQQLNQNGEVESQSAPPAPVDANKDPVTVRATQSTFWGNIPALGGGVSAMAVAAFAALQSVLPLPPLSKASFNETTNLPVSSTPPTTIEQPPATATTPTISQTEDNGIFTLKERSRKRKAEEQPEEETPVSAAPEVNGNGNQDKIMGDFTETTTQTHRTAAQQKRAAKAAKKQAKKDAAASAAADFAKNQPEPFDYAAAAPLLINNPEHAAQIANGPPAVKPMNPFAKALDTGTGARRNRLGKELAGKSMTFKS